MAESKTYAFRIYGKDIVMGCQSGGAFRAIATLIIETGGIVYGVAYDKSMATYCRVTNKSQLNRLSGSKYVQACLNCYNKLEDDIRMGKLVLFSGSPCYVAAILKYLELKKIDKKNLVTVEFLCHGVPSPRLFESYLEYEKRKGRIGSSSFIFRDKNITGWGGNYSRIVVNKIYSKFTTTWMDIYGAERYLRDSCYQCKFTTWKRNADITIADFWGIKNIPQIDYDPIGLSMILFNNSNFGWIEAKLSEYGSIIETTKEANDQSTFHHPVEYKDDGIDLDWQNRDFEENAYAIFRHYSKREIKVIFGIPITLDMKFIVSFILFRIKKSALFLKLKILLLRSKKY